MANRLKLSVLNLSKTFVTLSETNTVVRDVSLDVYENEFLVLLGPGQCGKSVFLNMIAGLTNPTLGEMRLDGKPIRDAFSQHISMVFQRVSLLPWLTVTKNVQIGLKYAGVPKAEREAQVLHYIELVGLKGFENYYPYQLSGGMKQRVGIARAYACKPEVLLMDEPFGKLDAQTRYSMQDEILRIWEKEKRTIVFVTNNIEEAIYLADRVVVFSKRPATIKNITNLSDFARPRDYMDHAFLEQREQLAELMDLDLGYEETAGGNV